MQFKISSVFMLLFLLLFSCDNLTSNPQNSRDAKQQVVRFNAADQIAKPTVVMISIDGFRADYLDTFKPPTLLSWAKDGIRSDGLIPSFPTLTFPNHISLVTGLKPGRHGIVGNKFYDEKRKEYYSMGDGSAVNDGSWYRGEPLWTAAEKQGMLSATCFWVGSEAKIGGIDPTYLKEYDGSISNDQRVQWVKEWLSLPLERRPHFISLYFSDVDSAGHKFGPKSPEAKKAVLSIDTSLGELKKFIAQNKLDVQVILVSDHGMKTIDQTVDISSVVNTSLKGFAHTGRGALVSFYSGDEVAIDKAYGDLKKIPGNFSVLRPDEFPEHWGLDDPERRGDIVVVGNPGVYIGFAEGFADPVAPVGSSNKATHGWDARGSRDLNGLFIANGSLFKKGMRIPAIDNVHVYPLVMNILKLNVTTEIDGKLSILKPTLRLRRN